MHWALPYAATREPVLERLASLGLRAAEAPSWFDVDHGPDLERLEEVLVDTPERAPAVHRELSAHGDGPRLSVVVATLDEGRALDACLDALAEQPGPVEVVVSDGALVSTLAVGAASVVLGRDLDASSNQSAIDQALAAD